MSTQIMVNLEKQTKNIISVLEKDEALRNMIYDMIKNQKLPDDQTCNIYKLGHPFLYASPQKVKFPLDEETKKDILLLKNALKCNTSSAGIAANQLGINKQIIVYTIPQSRVQLEPNYSSFDEPRVLINPVLDAMSVEKYYAWEGCLSIPGIRMVVPRCVSTHLSAYNEDGIFLEEDHTGFHSRCLQHEIDHLNGKTLLDYMQEYQELFHEDEIKHYPIELRKDTISDIL